MCVGFRWKQVAMDINNSHHFPNLYIPNLQLLSLFNFVHFLHGFNKSCLEWITMAWYLFKRSFSYCLFCSIPDQKVHSLQLKFRWFYYYDCTNCFRNGGLLIEIKQMLINGSSWNKNVPSMGNDLGKWIYVWSFRCYSGFFWREVNCFSVEWFWDCSESNLDGFGMLPCLLYFSALEK